MNFNDGNHDYYYSLFGFILTHTHTHTLYGRLSDAHTQVITQKSSNCCECRNLMRSLHKMRAYIFSMWLVYLLAHRMCVYCCYTRPGACSMYEPSIWKRHERRVRTPNDGIKTITLCWYKQFQSQYLIPRQLHSPQNGRAELGRHCAAHGQAVRVRPSASGIKAGKCMLSNRTENVLFVGFTAFRARAKNK